MSALDKFYRAGTVSVTTGTKTVTIAGGDTLQFSSGDLISIEGHIGTYEIGSITDITHFELKVNYVETTVSGQEFRIEKKTKWADVSDRVRVLIELLSNTVLTALAAIAPGVRKFIWYNEAGVPETKPLSNFALSFLDDADGAAVRTTIGAAAELELQTQATMLSGNLSSIAALASAADTLGYFDGDATANITALTAAGRDFIGKADAEAMKAYLSITDGIDGEPGTPGTPGAGGMPSVILEDQRLVGTNGGSAIVGVWATRALNTIVSDTDSLVTLASNRFSFSENGWIEWSAPCFGVERHKTRLFNITDGGWEEGTSEYAHTTYLNQTSSTGGFSVVAGKEYEIKTRVTVSKTTNGHGVAVSFGDEIYTRLKFWRA